MKRLLLGLLIVNAMTFCSKKTPAEKKREIHEGKIDENLVLGIWTDGSGPNASISIEADSIFDVEHFESNKYELIGDSLTIYYDQVTFNAKIKKLDADSLIYVSEFGETKMWRFTN